MREQKNDTQIYRYVIRVVIVVLSGTPPKDNVRTVSTLLKGIENDTLGNGTRNRWLSKCIKFKKKRRGHLLALSSISRIRSWLFLTELPPEPCKTKQGGDEQKHGSGFGCFPSGSIGFGKVVSLGWAVFGRSRTSAGKEV